MCVNFPNLNPKHKTTHPLPNCYNTFYLVMYFTLSHDIHITYNILIINFVYILR